MMAQHEEEEVLDLQINTAVFNSCTNQFLAILKGLKQSGTEWQMFNHCIQALKTLQLHCEKNTMWALPRCKCNVDANWYTVRGYMQTFMCNLICCTSNQCGSVGWKSWTLEPLSYRKKGHQHIWPPQLQRIWNVKAVILDAAGLLHCRDFMPHSNPEICHLFCHIW